VLEMKCQIKGAAVLPAKRNISWEDPTRPVTGYGSSKSYYESGFGALLDVPGLNYRVHLYDEALQNFHKGLF
jgi:hypothetical protein